LSGYDTPKIPYGEAAHLVGGSEVSFLNTLFGVFEHVPMSPTEAWDVAGDELANCEAMIAGTGGITLASAVCPEGVFVAFTLADWAAALVADMRFASLDDARLVEFRRIVIAVAVVAHDASPVLVVSAVLGDWGWDWERAAMLIL
jgi:hypothetical protein